MSYPVIQLEVTQPLSPVRLSAAHTGIALVLRRRGRLIGQLLRGLATPCTVPTTQLETWIAEAVGSKILQDCLQDELQPTLTRVDRPPTLTVAICTKDRSENVARLLNSLVSLQRTGEETHYKILVVDNAPKDDRTQAVVASFLSVTYVHEPRAGLNFARNRALNTATTEWLAFLDDDVTVDRQWFQGWQEAWAENPDAGAITGLVLPYELETPAQILFERRGGFGRGFEKVRYGQMFPGNPLYPCGAGMFGAGCNMAFRRLVLRDLGGFDEALDTGKPLPGGGDLDMFFRVIRAGYPLVYEPQYAVYHQHRRTIRQLRHQYWTWGLGFMTFVTKAIQSDVEMRSLLIKLIAWWLKDQLWQLQKSVFGFHLLPPSMILAEFYGGVVGLFGEYGRSQRRVAAIRRQFS